LPPPHAPRSHWRSLAHLTAVAMPMMTPSATRGTPPTMR
jgi:hypothetical protein